jgi:hypothetical protein
MAIHHPKPEENYEKVAQKSPATLFIIHTYSDAPTDPLESEPISYFPGLFIGHGINTVF